jgi:hypothetical protein
MLFLGVNENSNAHIRDLTEAPIGPRSIVVTSPDKIDECKWEFEADTEKFLEAIEVCSSYTLSVSDADLNTENNLSVRMGRI